MKMGTQGGDFLSCWLLITFLYNHTIIYSINTAVIDTDNDQAGVIGLVEPAGGALMPEQTTLQSFDSISVSDQEAFRAREQCFLSAVLTIAGQYIHTNAVHQCKPQSSQTTLYCTLRLDMVSTILFSSLLINTEGIKMIK